jgi:hypothetical protein
LRRRPAVSVTRPKRKLVATCRCRRVAMQEPLARSQGQLACTALQLVLQLLTGPGRLLPPLWIAVLSCPFPQCVMPALPERLYVCVYVCM